MCTPFKSHSRIHCGRRHPWAAQVRSAAPSAHRHRAERVLVGVHDVWVGQVGGQHRLKDAALACGAGMAWAAGLVGDGLQGAQVQAATSLPSCRAERTSPGDLQARVIMLHSRAGCTPGAIPASSSGSVVSITFTATVVPFQLPRYTCAAKRCEKAC